jgi:hypothetical protein
MLDVEVVFESQLMSCDSRIRHKTYRLLGDQLRLNVSLGRLIDLGLIAQSVWGRHRNQCASLNCRQYYRVTYAVEDVNEELRLAIKEQQTTETHEELAELRQVCKS